MSEQNPTQPECKGCVFPGNCPCFDKDWMESANQASLEAVIELQRRSRP